MLGKPSDCREIPVFSVLNKLVESRTNLTCRVGVCLYVKASCGNARHGSRPRMYLGGLHKIPMTKAVPPAETRRGGAANSGAIKISWSPTLVCPSPPPSVVVCHANTVNW